MASPEPPAPSRPFPRGFAGPSLFAMILVGEFCHHLPLNRQSAAFAREGIELEVSTLADWVGGCAALEPILAELRRHVLAAERLHVDDTTVKVLAKIKTRTGRFWVYVRDDRPFGGQGPPAALIRLLAHAPRRVSARFSPPGRGSCRPTRFSGYNALYEKGREPTPVVEATGWAHGRRDFFDFAKLAKAPIAVEIVRRIDELFAIERAINGEPAEVRREVRQERSKPLVAALEAYMREQSRRLSPKNKVAKPIRYMLSRWASFTRFLDDGRVCLSNNAAERARAVRRGRAAQLDLRGIRRGRTPGGCDLLPRSNLPPQRRRSARPARRCPRPTPRAKRVSELTPWAWQASRNAGVLIAAE